MNSDVEAPLNRKKFRHKLKLEKKKLAVQVDVLPTTV